MKALAKMALLSCVVVLVVFAGCSRKEGGQQGNRVGFIVGSRQHVFYNMIEQGIREAAPTVGIVPIVMDGDLDGNVTSDHINNFLAMGVKAIALSANDPGGTIPAIRNANASGVPVFTFDTTIADSSLIRSFIGTDNVEGGRLGGRETIRLASHGSKVGIINFDDLQSCIDRRIGWEEVVRASDKNLAIIEIGNYTGDASRAEQLMTDALILHPDIAVIFAVGDPAAVGALAAIKVAGAATKVIGFDGNPEAIAAILDPVNGEIWVSEISQNPLEIGRQITHKIRSYLDTGVVDQSVILLAPYIITKENATR